MENPSSDLSSRKKDHIDLALKSRTGETDKRFLYEPMLAAHPEKGSLTPVHFLGYNFRAPLWVSSMTGGTKEARNININLARAAGEFGFGMGLGSCRPILEDESAFFADFDIREHMGHDVPLYANLGIAQCEELLENDATDLAVKMVERLHADGLIIHVNPMQEFTQPEGDLIRRPPVDTIQAFLEKTRLRIIVKEVGQGFGPASMKALLKMQLEAIDFGASGGTNFAMLELLRSDENRRKAYEPLCYIGHTASEMVGFVNQALAEIPTDELRCRQIIISGGVTNFLDGYSLIKSVSLPSVFGMASAFLPHARGDYETLKAFVEMQIRGLEVAEKFLEIRNK